MDRTRDEQGELTEQMAPRVAEGVLGGLPGLGILDVGRGADGGIVEVLGTWRLEDEGAGLDTSPLRRAYETGESVRYEGALHDEKHPDRDHVEVDVRIINIETYLYSEAEYEDHETERTLYKFRPVKSLPYQA